MRAFFSILMLVIFLGCSPEMKEAFQKAYYPDRTGSMDVSDCELVNTALRNAGYTDMTCQHGTFRLTGPSKISVLYLEAFCLIAGGGWGTAKVKVEGDFSNPIVTLLSVNRRK